MCALFLALYKSNRAWNRYCRVMLENAGSHVHLSTLGIVWKTILVPFDQHSAKQLVSLPPKGGRHSGCSASTTIRTVTSQRPAGVDLHYVISRRQALLSDENHRTVLSSKRANGTLGIKRFTGARRPILTGTSSEGLMGGEIPPNPSHVTGRRVTPRERSQAFNRTPASNPEMSARIQARAVVGTY